MAYCVNCGTEIVPNAKFCQKCGHPTGAQSDNATRKQEFAGKIYKCPNCGLEIDRDLNAAINLCNLKKYSLVYSK